jgi:hypothetical protein
MKKLLLSLTLISVVVLSACNSKKEEQKRDMVLLNDSLFRSNMNTDTAVMVQNEPVEEAPFVAPRPQQNRRPAAQRTGNVRSNNTNYENNQTLPPPVVNTPAPTPAATTTTGTETAAGTAKTDSVATAGETAKKEGISKGAKGAIIGGVGGAIAGAIITKKGKGAVIGGVIGAAGGYILGRKKDKQDGRVNN